MVFARVVDAGSLTRAAKALGSTRSAISKSLARLEDHLGTRLLHRTTRHLNVTTAGHACYARCVRIVAEVTAAEHEARELGTTVHGTLRASCSLSLGWLLAPQIPAFVARHPKLSLEVGLSESMIDLVREGVDVGIRLGRMPDSSLVARKLAPYRRVICASPTYLAKRSAPRTPPDLARHDCVLRIGHDHWQFRDGVSVRVHGSYRADTPELLRQGALAGLGIAMLPSFLVTTDLAKGRLVAMLDDQIGDRAAIYAVYPPHRQLAPNLRAFLDFLVEALAPLAS